MDGQRGTNDQFFVKTEKSFIQIYAICLYLGMLSELGAFKIVHDGLCKN